jgi:filamentous hemagglutinin family protein
MRFVVSLLLGVCGFLLSGQAGFAQSIVGQDETIVKPTGNDFIVDGGAVAGQNLFHSFVQFGLGPKQTVTFELKDPAIANIFARVTGGNPSWLNGNVAIGGGKLGNFYLMNPAGVIFGPNFQLPTGLPLTATTANGVMFDSQWWSATGVNDYDVLTKDPVAFGFTSAQPAAIINRWASGDTPLTLVAGTVISPADSTAIAGNLTAGNLTMVAVPGNRFVRITSTGNLLGLEIRPFAAGESLPNAGVNAVPSLAQLITGPGPNGGTIGDATGLQVNPDGTVLLSGASLHVGDVYAGNLTANGVLIGAPTGNVTVATIEARDAGVQVVAGQHFQATSSRVYDNVRNGLNSGVSSVRASIAVLGPDSLLPGTVSIAYGTGSSLNVSTDGARAAGNATFILGGTATSTLIPVDISGTANAIVVAPNSGDAAGLVIAYANQTFGQIGPVPGAALTTTMSSQQLTAESSIESSAEPPKVNDRTQANRHCAATSSSGAKRTIIAMRSATTTATSGSCATDSDDAAILKILE